MAPGTGNAVTASRLAALLCSLRPLTLGAHPPVLIDAGAPDAGERVTAALATGRVDLAVAVHAYRAGRHFVAAADVLACGGVAAVSTTPTTGSVSAPVRGASASGLPAPLVVVLGGTDINVDAVPLMQPPPQWRGSGGGMADGVGGAAAALDTPPLPLPPPSSRQRGIADIVRRSLSLASAVVAFTDDMAARFSAVAHALDYPTLAADASTAAARRVFVIPQAVAEEGVTGGAGDWTGPHGVLGVHGDPPTALAPPPPSLRSLLGLPPSSVVLLLVAGLRPVKRPLALAPAIAAWHAVEPRVNLVIVGPALDPEVAAAVVATTGCDPALVTGPLLPHAVHDPTTHATAAAPSRFGGAGGVWYVPFVPRAVLLAWLRAPGDEGVTAAVNSSSCEGQPGALLEAQAAGVPVVAACVPGNVTVVEHGVSGLLYHTPAGALRAVARLVGGAAGLRPPPVAQGAGGWGAEGGDGAHGGTDVACAVCGGAVDGTWGATTPGWMTGGRCGCGCSGGGGGGRPAVDAVAGVVEEEGAVLRARLVAGGHASVRERHSEEGEARRWEEVLRAVLPS